MSHTKSKSGPPRFQVGNKVRVKYGVIDPDFSDIHLGAIERRLPPLPGEPPRETSPLLEHRALASLPRAMAPNKT